MPDWAESAACRGVSPDVFFSDDGEEALTYCNRCPVRTACLAEAMNREANGWELPLTIDDRGHWRRSPAGAHRWGIWGGLKPKERAELARSGRLVRRVS